MATTSIVANVGSDSFALPTPCEQFDVRTLINHMIAGNYRFLAVANGEPAASVPAMGDFVDQDALGPYRESADALAKGWSDPAALERTARLPIGDVPGIVALGVHTVETIAHGWDLAKATGQPTEVDAELCAVAWEYAQGIDDSLTRTERAVRAGDRAAGGSVSDRRPGGLARPPTLTRPPCGGPSRANRPAYPASVCGLLIAGRGLAAARLPDASKRSRGAEGSAAEGRHQSSTRRAVERTHPGSRSTATARPRDVCKGREP